MMSNNIGSLKAEVYKKLTSIFLLFRFITGYLIFANHKPWPNSLTINFVAAVDIKFPNA